MIPRSVSSLIMPTALPSARLAILFSLQIQARPRRRGRRVAADRLPTPIVIHPYVGQDDAILDHPPKIFEPPAGMHRPDHHIFEHGGVLNLDVDLEHVAALDGVEPFV